MKATRGILTQVRLAPSSQMIGDLQSDLTLSFRVSNPVPQNGKLKVTFPYWNPDAQGTIFRQFSYLQSPTTVQCLPKSGSPMKSSITCTFDSSTQTLTVSNLFSSAVTSGTEISFTIKQVRNPVSTTPVSNIQIQTIDDTSKEGVIDGADGTLSVTNPGKITTSLVKPDSSLIQDLTQYRVEFLVPVPLSAGCILEIVFPAQIPLGSELTIVQAFGMPNAQRTMTGSIDKTRNSYVITNGCPQYRDNTNSAIIIFRNIRNPYVQIQTDPLEILISDSGQRLVCSTLGQGPKVTTIPGDMNVEKLTTEVTTEINQPESVLFQLQPFHIISANSQILIKFPTEFALVPSPNSLSSDPECQYTGVSTNMIQIMQSCQYSIVGGVKQIVINNAFLTDYIFSSTSSIKFKVHNMKLPPSEGPIGNFDITVSSFTFGQYYPVSTKTAPLLFQATRAALGSGFVTPDSFLANQVAPYVFTVQVNNPILQGGYFIIALPTTKEIAIPNLAAAKCSDFSSNFQSVPDCSFNQTHITVRNGFTEKDLTKDQGPLVFKVSGILNPRSLKTTSSFAISTFDSKGYTIEFKKDQMPVTMSQVSMISNAQVQPQITVVGSLTNYLFTLTPATPLISGDQLILSFPADFNVPLATTLQSCVAASPLLSQVSCKLNGPSSILLTLSFSSSSPQLAQFSFSVQQVQNPPSTVQTQQFSVDITDSQGFLINRNNPTIASFSVKMQAGAEITEIGIVNQNRRPNVMTAYTITMRSADVPLQKNAVIEIKYPEQVGIDERFTGCILSNKSPWTTCTFDDAQRVIRIEKVTDVVIEAGTQISITLYGLINSKLAAATDSFEIDIFTESGNQVLYKHTGLTVTCECDYPCITCMKNAPSKCLTCDTQSDFSLFLNNQCLIKCPMNYYPSEYQCKRCDPACMECADGGTKCTKCYKGNFLQGNTCVNKCRVGVEYQNELLGTCDTCKSPCETCSSSISTCESCLQTVPQRLFYMQQCLTQCPANVTVEKESSCLNCSSNCKTCTGLTSVCTSCNQGMKLDVTDSVCKSTCPAGITVETGDQCLPCDPTCKTCASTDRNYCLSCQYGLQFHESQHQCLVKCPNRTVMISEKQVSYCRDCEAGCLECQNKTSYCTKCDSDYVFYKFTCVKDQCPTGYKRISDERNVCVKEREDCKYGYAYNDFGECALVVQVCEPGYILNTKLNRCIPIPGFYIPFLFLAIALIWTLYIYRRFKQGHVADKHQLLIQLLTGYTHIQTITYFIMFCLSIALDYKLVTAIHLTTLFTMLLCNLAVSLYLHLRLRKQDATFRHWVDLHKKPYTYLRWLLAAYNFKSLRLFYSGLRADQPLFSAPFENLYKTIIRPLFFCTVTNFLLQAGPIILMDAYNLMFIPWGYQIMVMSIDNMILAIVIFVLEIIEFAYFKRRAVEEGQLIGKAKIESENRVFGAGEDYEGDDQSLMYLNKDNRNGGLSQQEVKALENMYMTKDGYKKKQQIESNDSYRQTDAGHKYLDPDQISLGNLSKGRHLSGRHSLLTYQDKTQEQRLLENIVRRLQEEQKFNHLQSEPASDKDVDQTQLPLTLDPETKALMGSIDDTKLMTDDQKKRLIVETARERVESKLSFRQQVPKSHAKVVEERIAAEMQRAVQQCSNQQEDALQKGVIPNEKEKNMDSARTVKFNNYPPPEEQIQTGISRGMSPIAIGVGSKRELAKSTQPTTRGGINDPERLAQRDRRDFALYFRDFKKQLKLQQRERQPNRKDWHSFDGDLLRDWYDDMECESYFEDQVSNESYPHKQDKLRNPEYLARLELFRQNIKPFNQFNNVYTQKDDPALQANRKAAAQKIVTRRTQTYERDIGVGYDPFDHEDDQLLTEEDRAIEYDPQFAQDLLRNLIDNLSELPSSRQDSDQGYPRNTHKRRITRENFDLDDILGSFEIDDHGNLIIDQDTLTDNLGRKVNKHGYLVDKRGNIINQDGEVLFNASELEDEDIPQPYRFEKRRRHLLKQKDVKYGLTIENAEARRLFDIDAVLVNEEEQIEDEFNRLRELSRPSSVDSLMGGNNAEVAPAEEQQEVVVAKTEEGELDDDKRQREMAKAYGGKPPVKKTKKKKRAKKQGPQTLEDINAPPTDRLFPGLMHQEDERVKKIARVAYRNQQADGEERDDTADAIGFQEFFKRSMEEIQQQRALAREELQRKSQMYVQGSPNQTTNEELARNQNLGFESDQTLGIDNMLRNPQLDSSISTNRQNVAPFWNPVGSQSPERLRAVSIPELKNEGTVDDEIETDAVPIATTGVPSNRDDVYQLNPNPSSAYTAYNNLQFNHRSSSTVNNNNYHLASGPSLPSGGAVLRGNPFYPSQDERTTQTAIFPTQQQNLSDNDIHNEFTLADQSEPIVSNQQQVTGLGFKKFDFYLPNQKKKAKKNREKRDLNFSDVGAMQMQTVSTANNSRIRDLERLYLQKYPGHNVGGAGNQSTLHTRAVNPSVQYNQYVNTIESASQHQRAPTAQSSNLLNQTAVSGAMRRKGAPSPMRGNTTTIGGASDFNQTGSTTFQGAYQNHRASSGSNERPLSSFTNMPRQNVAGHILTNDGGQGDVFDSMARVLNNIDRLKSSEGPRGGVVANFYNQRSQDNISSIGNPNDETRINDSTLNRVNQTVAGASLQDTWI